MNLESRIVQKVQSAIPKSEIISVYLKGSYVRNEMIQGSDVDVLVVLKTAKFLPHLKKINFDNICYVGYSLRELKTGKRVKNKSSTTPVSRTVRHLPSYLKIYGEKLDTSGLHTRTALEDYQRFKKFLEQFIEQYQAGKVGFREVGKQVLWLAYDELLVQGKMPTYSWKNVVSLLPKHHIAHTAYHYRLHPTKDEKKRSLFIEEIKKYLKK
ncbi:MAG TPA: nucleotidyltransferase domain-containing protein [Acidobacteriota bacterium]|nr:nucleotidyltransferase domain-containing protein [Acidobacteriota bacterium]